MRGKNALSADRAVGARNSGVVVTPSRCRTTLIAKSSRSVKRSSASMVLSNVRGLASEAMDLFARESSINWSTAGSAVRPGFIEGDAESDFTDGI
jgi:hypothetical protein